MEAGLVNNNKIVKHFEQKSCRMKQAGDSVEGNIEID